MFERRMDEWSGESIYRWEIGSGENRWRIEEGGNQGKLGVKGELMRDTRRWESMRWWELESCIRTVEEEIAEEKNQWCMESILSNAWLYWKSDLTDKRKRSFFQEAVVSILLYGWTTWTLTKRIEKKLDGNYTRMLPAILNKSWRQHPTKRQLYGHLPPITKTIS